MRDQPVLSLRVAAAEAIAPTLRRVSLRAADGARLPPAAAGAHITLSLPASGHARPLKNAYTLVSADLEHGYTLIVRRTDPTRGGSQHIHEALAVGDVLEASVPHNLFALHSQAKKVLMIGGGIGITPLLAFIAALRARGTRFELHQICNSADLRVFAALIGAQPGEAVHLHAGRSTFDAAVVLGAQPLGTHVYSCGPAALMDAIAAQAAALGWPASHVHREDFGAAGGEPFTLTIGTSGARITVAADQTMLEALEAAGIDAGSLCRGGACGVCALPVRAGELEHRDHYLSADERQSGAVVMPCVSRARGDSLVLDI
ncbi:PDR/VanB family oxidoreductase [Novosphingobium sp. Chol11]|uniref:PDR/VanB family oxidoreductase n=1 Tax=Novosphingobium sp. Chol11 TaxID=1385763 RepID=UPI0025E8417B|nr:PDR/VanB family oxidoreductase [Novosphingobium sp. Chol11]